MNKKTLVKMKSFFSSIALGLLMVPTIFNFSLGMAYAASTQFNTDGLDLATLRVANRTTNADFANPTAASIGDRILFAVYYHNTGTDTATNTIAAVDFSNTASTSVAVTGKVWADNAPVASLAGTVNVGTAQVLQFEPVAKWYPNHTTTNPVDLNITNTGNSVQVNIGSIVNNGWVTQGSVYFYAVLVNGGPAASADITTQPAGAGSVDNALSTQPVIHVMDQYGNNVPNGTVVTASLVTGTGVLRNVTATTVNGYATFVGLGYSKSGEAFTMKFTANGHDSATSSSVGPLTLGVASAVEITTQPAGAGSVDNALSTQPVIHVTDQYGNNVPDGASVTASLVTGTGVLRNAVASTVGGYATFTNLGYSKSGEAFTMKFTVSGHDSATSSSVGPLTQGAVASAAITTQPVGAGSVDNPLSTQPVIHVTDQYGNNVADGITVTASLDTGTGVLRNVTATTVNGYATFTNLGYSKSGETFTLLFSAAGHNSAISSSVGPLALGAATKMTLATSSASANVGNSVTLTATILDQYSNVVTTDNATQVTFTADGHSSWTPHRATAVAGVATSTLSDTTNETVNVSITSSSVLNPLNEVSVTFNLVGAPVLSLISATPSQYTSVISFTSDIAGKAKINYGQTDTYGLTTDYPLTNNMVSGANSITLGSLDCGTTYHYAIYSKNSSNVESISADQTFTTTACPSGAATVVITAPTAGATVSGSVTVTATNGVEYQVDGGAWIAIATAINTTLLTNGSHQLRARSSAPIGYSDPITIVVNNGVVPTFVWTTPVAGSTIANTATVDATYTVTNFDTGTVAYSVNGGVWIAAGDASQNAIAVSTGSNTIQLRATTTINSVVYTGYSSINTFTVAAPVAPTVTITAPTAGSTVNGSVTVTSVNGTEYQVDGGSWIAIATPIDTTLLTNGSHQLRARGGTPTGYSDIITVVVNNGVVPTFVWTTPVAGSTIANVATVDATYTITNFDTGTVTYSVNGGAWTGAGDASQNAIVVQTGTNTLQLRATRTVNSVVTTGYSSINTFTVAAPVAPTVTITAPTAGATVSGSVTVTATNGTEYQVDGGSWIAIATAINTTLLTNGSHQLRARGGSPLGYSDTMTVVVNNGVVPTFAWTTPTAGSTIVNTATIDSTYTVTNFDIGSVFYSVNGGVWTAAGDAAQNAIAVSTGTNTLQLRATTTINSVVYTGYSSINTFTVAAPVAPTVTITAPTAGATVSGSVTVTATNGTEYQVDGGSWTAIATAIDTTLLANGSHTVRARGGSPLGYSDIVTMVVNNGVVPTFTWTTPTPGSTIANTATVNSTYTITNFDTGTVTYSVNGGVWIAAGDASQNAIAVSTGTNTLQLRASKVINSITYTGYSSINTFTVAEPVAPTVTITAPTAGSTVNGSVTVTSVNGTEYQVDGGSWIAIATPIDTTLLVNGSHQLRARGGTPTGYSDTMTVVVNNGVVPTFTWTTPVPGSTIANTTTVDSTYTITNFDTGTVTYSVNGGAWTSAGDASQNAIAVSIGTNTLQLRATRTVNSVVTTGYSSINTFTVATAVAPTVTITAPTAGATVSGSVTVTATNGTEYQVDGGAWTAIATPIDTTLLVNGSHQLRARGGSPLGYSDTMTVVVNNGVVPTFTWTTPTPGSTIANTATVNATYTITNFDTGTVTYSVNGGAWTAAGDAAQNAIAVQDGTNTIQLRATRTVNSVTTTGYSSINTFTVLTAAASTVTITAPTAGSTVSGSVTVTATNGTEYQVDGGAWTAIANPISTTILANGSHTIRARGGSPLGYSDTITVVVNNGVVPTFTWTTPVPGSTIANAATITATYTVANFDSATIFYSVNGGAWIAAGDATQSGITVSAGTNTLQLKGNKTVNSVIYTGYSSINTFTVAEPVAPTVTITAPTTGSTVTGSVTVTATNGTEYQVDGGSWIAIATPIDTTLLVNGSHQLRARGGTPTGYSDAITIIVNNVVTPTFAWTTPTPGSTIANTATVNATYTVTNFDTGTVAYSVNGGAWTVAGDASQNGIAVQDGTNTIQLKATKTVSGTTTTGYSTVNTFTVASLGGGGSSYDPPVFTWTTPVPGSTIANTATVNATYTITNLDAGSVFYSVNGGAWIAAGDASQNNIAVQVGTNTIQLKATKTNAGVSSVGYSAVDTFVVSAAVAPTVTITAPTAGSTVTGSVTVTSINGTEYQVDGGSWVAIANAIDTTLLANGSHTIRARGGSPLGYSDTITIVVNNGVVPTFAWTTPVTGSVIANTLTVNSTYTITNFDGGTVAYSINGGAWTAAGDASQNGIAVSTGTNTLQLRATKTVNSVTTTGYSSINTFTVLDANAATVTITAPTAGSAIANSVVVSATNGVQYQVDGGSWITIATPIDTTLLTNGSHTIRARGGSPVGYSDIIVVTVDNHDLTIPTISSWTPADGATDVNVAVGFVAGNTRIALTFSEAMDATTLNNANIKLYRYSDDSEVSVSDIVSANGNTVVNIIPTANLAYGTQYYITVNGSVKDLVGNSFAAVWNIGNKASHEFTTATQPTGSLVSDAPAMIKTTGIADNTYANGWEWIMRITLPTTEPGVALKFTDWVSGSNTLLAAGNMQYYSDQIAAGTGSAAAPVQITAANTYPAPVTVTSDADATRAGIQTDIHIMIKIPVSTVGGSYSTSYGVQSY